MGVQVVVQGLVCPDGTLQLDGKVPMPAGRVQVTLQPAVQPPVNDPFWTAMERIWADQKAQGRTPRTKEQIDAELENLRNEADEEMHAVERLYEECHGSGQPKKDQH